MSSIPLIYRLLLKNRLPISEKLDRTALWILKSIAAIFFISCLLIIITIFMNRMQQPKEIKLRIEQVKEIEQTDRFPYFKKNERYEKNAVKYQADGPILDSLREFSSSLMHKIETIQSIESSINNIEERNSDLFKLFLALIGSIFAIVGFFGFKSIHDTRQSAIDTVKTKADETLKALLPKELQIQVNDYLKGDIGSNVIKEASSKKAEQVAFEKSIEVARNTAKDEVLGLKLDDKEFRKSIFEELTLAKKDNKLLLRRIQDLEEKLYGLPKEESDMDSPTNSNEQSTIVEPVV